MFSGEHKQTDIAQSAIFTTGSMRASRLYPAIFLTSLILYADYSLDLSSKIRLSISYISSPLTQLEYLASDTYQAFNLYFSSQKRLMDKIYFLEEKIIDLENTNISLINTKNSLNELEKIIGLSKSFDRKNIFFGKVQDYKKFPNERIDVEVRTENISKNMIVFNAFGLIGVIEEILNNSVKVKPLHDLSLKIPAKNLRTLENIIITGSGEPKSFFVEDFKKNGDVSLGDEIVTTGLGGKFPEEFSIGKVSSILESPESNFLNIKIQNNFDFKIGSTFLFTEP